MKYITDPQPGEATFNIKSKLINWTEVARKIGVNPATLHNRLNQNGRHRPLTTAELTEIKNLIENDLFKPL